MATATYRVSILGFRVNRETVDDMLQFDGKRDEVFITASVKYIDKDGNFKIPEQNWQTPTMGDTNNNPGRVLAGSASRLGGLRTGDAFPIERPWEFSGPFDGRDYPPFIVWEGTLTDGEDSVFITPVIWEWDPGESIFLRWIEWIVDVDNQFGKKAKEIVSTPLPAYGWIFDAVSLGIQTAGKLDDLLGVPGHRPIGIRKDAANPNGGFNPQVLVLTRSMAEALAQKQPLPGIQRMSYKDGEDLAGDYELWVKVERIGPITPDVPRVQWEPIGGLWKMASGPTICSRGEGRFDVFATDSFLYHLAIDGHNTSDWHKCPFQNSESWPLICEPAAISSGPNRFAVFVRDVVERLQHYIYKPDEQDPWGSKGNVADRKLIDATVCSSAPGRLDLFARGWVDRTLYHCAYIEGGIVNSWEQLGNEQIGHKIAAVSWGPNRMDVFVIGTDKAVYHKSWKGNHWSGYESLGGEFADTCGLAACSWGPERLDVFSRSDGKVYHKCFDGTWSNTWEILAENIYDNNFQGICATSSGPNGIDLFVVYDSGAGTRLHHRWWDGRWRP